MAYAFDLKDRSYRFSVKIVKYLRPLYEKDRYSRRMIEQLRDSATSVSANIHEAKFSESTKNYLRFYEYALRSGNEAVHWLNLFKDTLDVDVSDIKKLIAELEEILKVLAASFL